jgi:hypothetical protein
VQVIPENMLHYEKLKDDEGASEQPHSNPDATEAHVHQSSS